MGSINAPRGEPIALLRVADHGGEAAEPEPDGRTSGN
jgi:hypothetical protein